MGLAIPDSLTFSSESGALEPELEWPFGKLDVDKDDLRETSYEIFFTSCRSSPGFGGRSPLTYIPSPENGEFSGGVAKNGLGLVGTSSRIKRMLGLKNKRSSPKRATVVPSPPMRPKRPLTTAELMRQQMKISEQNDSRLRKTLMRILVGQMGRRAETIILPLELLRQLKPSEFNDGTEYHLWQKRQLKMLELGLLLHPSIPYDRSSLHASKLRDIVKSVDLRPIDTSKNSDTMKILCSSVLSLAWRTTNGSPADICHWADGFPVNLHLYLSLLQSCFDLRDETLVIDEVDELMDLMKKTWTTLGINRLIHNVCFTWVMFEQFVVTGQIEQDLLGAALTMLAEVANDAKRASEEFLYMKILAATLTAMQSWAERWLLDYHERFRKGGVVLMECVLPLALSAAQILGEEKGDSTGNRVDYYIRASARNAFNRLLEDISGSDGEEATDESLVALAKRTEALATREKEIFSPVLKRWHPVSAAVASVTLHNCYGSVLKNYLNDVSILLAETIQVLEAAGKLEKVLVQVAVEDSVDCEDGGKGIIREMVPYESESATLSLMKRWVRERLKKISECVSRAKDTETWNPKSKSEPYAQSAVEITKMCKETVNDFFGIPVVVCDDFVQDLADGLETMFQDYISFVAACGTKQSYLPALPPLTRCSQSSKLNKIWRRASRCQSDSVNDLSNSSTSASDAALHPRPSTSRGTQRLYIRLNTLHFLLSHLHTLQKSLCLNARLTPSPSPRHHEQSTTRRRRRVSSFSSSSPPSSLFDLARSAINSATLHISEVVAYRLIFLDSSFFFYDSLYADGGVVNSRIRPALRSLKQNLSLLSAILTDRAQPVAIKEIMRASFEAFCMVLLAGGPSRSFARSDAEMVADDFRCLKQMFCGEGVMAEAVEDAAEPVEGVLALMGKATEQLIEDFSIVACEASGLGLSLGQKVPMPPTTGRWNPADPNTVLRVLCYRKDAVANKFLKRTFQLPKRRQVMDGF